MSVTAASLVRPRKPQKKFRRFYQFGFTGTPIFPENALGAETTASVFGRELHSYVITDAIRDEKVLKFKVDYNDVRPQFKSLETETDEKNSARLKTNRHFCTPAYPGNNAIHSQ
jgi:type I restriction enzyme R subunit